MTYTVRIDPADHELLQKVAKMYDKSPARLTQELLHEGIRRMLTPEYIDKYIEEHWGPIKAAAIEMQKEGFRL